MVDPKGDEASSESFPMAAGWRRESLVALATLACGALLLPVLIFYAGAMLLGRYEGATVGHLFGSIFAGLRQGSVASWLVVLGPYVLYLAFRALQAAWRLSARLI